MLGGEGRLLAFFKFQANEQRAPDRLLVRLALARLALPWHTVCVLLRDTKTIDRKASEVISRHFHYVTSKESLSSNIDHILAIDTGRYSLESLIEVQGYQYHRAAALISLSETWLREAFPRWLTQEQPQARDGLLMNDDAGFQAVRPWEELFDVLPLSTREQYEPVRSRSWFRGSRTLFPTLREHENVILGAASGPKLTARLARFGERLLLSTATLDNGIPFPQLMTHNLLLVDRVPVNSLDPMKAIRATCFAGWSLIGPPQLARFDQTLEEIRSLLPPE